VPARQLDPLADPRVQVGVVEEHGAEAAELAGALPAFDLVVIELGQLVREARHLGVLVDLGLPAVGDRGGQARPGHLGDGPLQPARQLLGQRISGRVRPPHLDDLLDVRGGHVDLGVEPLAGAAQPRDLQGDHKRIGHRGPRREAPGQRDDGYVLGPRCIGELPTGGGDDPPRPERAGGLVDGQRLLGVARVARAKHHAVRRGPGGQGVAPREDDRARGAVAQGLAGQRAPDPGPSHPGHDQTSRSIVRLEVGRLDPPQRVP
jgi:hypothetical protein